MGKGKMVQQVSNLQVKKRETNNVSLWSILEIMFSKLNVHQKTKGENEMILWHIVVHLQHLKILSKFFFALGTGQ